MNTKVEERANEPAYPVEKAAWDMGYPPGLTIREHFAGLVYAQFLNGAVLPPGFDAAQELRFAADRACEAADALIAALNQGEVK